ncbi:quinon protein alcohol dehydrogenase-like superfamily [Aspergillus heterothallicus]
MIDNNFRLYRSLDIDPDVDRSGDFDPTFYNLWPESYCLDVAISEDGRLLAIMIITTVKIFSTSSGELLTKFQSENRGPIKAIAKRPLASKPLSFAPNSQTLALCGDGVSLWDIITGQCLIRLDHDFFGEQVGVAGLAFSERSDLLALVNSQGELKLWNWKTNSNREGYNRPAMPPRPATVTTDGKLVITASGHHIEIWDAETGQLSSTLQGHGGEVYGLKLSCNNQVLLSRSDGQCMRLWSFPNGECLRVLNTDFYTFWDPSLSFDGKVAAYLTEKDTIELWDTSENRIVQIGYTDPHRTRFPAIAALSRDGRRIVTVGEEIDIWDTSSGKNICSIRVQIDWGSEMAFSADSSFLAICADSSNAVRLWDGVTGECVGSLHHENGAIAVAISDDGQILVSADRNDVIRVWDLQHNRLVNEMEWPGLSAGCADRFELSKDCHLLYFDRGCVKLHSGEIDERDNSGDWSMGQATFRPISVHGNWVLKGDTRILWIPPEYQVQRRAILRGRTIVLRPPGDVPIILRLREDL